MVGLLIFILSRHGENSHWRAVPQIASEACWLGSPCCMEGRAMVSSSRRFGLPILPLWAGERDSTQGKFLLQLWDQIQRVDLCWQGPEGASRRLRDWQSFFSLSHGIAWSCFIFRGNSDSRGQNPNKNPIGMRQRPSTIHPFFLILPWSGVTCSKMGSVSDVTQGGTPGHGAGGLKGRGWAGESQESLTLVGSSFFPFIGWTLVPNYFIHFI